jgi:hypothetical protein
MLLPTKIYKDLVALNELRNGLAHSFFPENRRVKPGWKGADIFSRGLASTSSGTIWEKLRTSLSSGCVGLIDPRGVEIAG